MRVWGGLCYVAMLPCCLRLLLCGRPRKYRLGVFLFTYIIDLVFMQRNVRGRLSVFLFFSLPPLFSLAASLVVVLGANEVKGGRGEVHGSPILYISQTRRSQASKHLRKSHLLTYICTCINNKLVFVVDKQRGACRKYIDDVCVCWGDIRPIVFINQPSGCVCRIRIRI